MRGIGLLSGLKIKIGKSSLVGISIEEYRMDILVGILGCEVGRLLMTYLELPSLKAKILDQRIFGIVQNPKGGALTNNIHVYYTL